MATRCYDFISEKAEVKSVTKEGIATASGILVENQGGSYLIQGNNLSFSKSGMGYTTEIRFDFNQVNDEQEFIEKYKEFFDQLYNNKGYPILFSERTGPVFQDAEMGYV